MVLGSSSAAASVYKYVDAQGTLSYTDDLGLAAPFKRKRP